MSKYNDDFAVGSYVRFDHKDSRGGYAICKIIEVNEHGAMNVLIIETDLEYLRAGDTRMGKKENFTSVDQKLYSKF